MPTKAAPNSGKSCLVSLDPLSLQILDYMGDAYAALGFGSSISRAVLVRRLIHAAPVHLSALVIAGRANGASRTEGDRSVILQEKHALRRVAHGVQHARPRYWVDVSAGGPADPFPTWAESDPGHDPLLVDTLIATADRLFG